ncbi:MAG: sensor domain-containing protein [Geminicoccaceae bacterium]
MLDRLRQIFENHPDPTCVISPDFRIILANPAFAQRFNQPPEVLAGMDYRDITPDVVRDRILAALKALTPEAPSCVLQLEMSQQGGGIRVTEFHGRAVFDEQGSLVEYHTFGRQLTEQVVAQRELERKNRFLDVIMKFLPVSLAIRDAKTRRFVLVNRSVGTDKSAADYVGKTFFELMPKEKASELTALDDQAVGDLSKTTMNEFIVDKADGRHFIHQRLRAVPGKDGKAEFILTLIEDVTDRWKILEDLRASEASLKRSQSMAKIGSWRFRHTTGQIEWSDQMYHLWGWEPGAFKPTRAAILAQIDRQDRAQAAAMVIQAVRSGRPMEAVFRLNSMGGAQSHIQFDVECEYDDEGELSGLFGTCQDVTDRISAEERIRQLACQDALTGLPNRFLFGDRLKVALSRTQREGASLAIHCLDLNDFKGVNDTLGHAAGDELLCQVADRLTKTLRTSDTVARLGGDEFAIIQAPIQTADEASILAERLIAAVGAPYRLGDHDVFTSTSVGIAVSPINGERPEELLRLADVALYQAKDRGRGFYQFFSSEMQERLQSRKKLEHDLRDALETDQFSLYFQPQICLRSGKLLGAEALLRWNHPERGLVPPDEFIPIAEDLGQILDIGRYVLLAACKEARSWLDLGAEGIKVAVNLSAGQFAYQDLLETVCWALSEANLPGQHLELEITETMLMRDREATIKTLQNLSNLGISLALDDFGTGYSSLSYLRRFQIDKIKIDRSFIADVPTNADGITLVLSILTLGHSLGLRVAAEGVETAAQHDFLIQRGCDEAQGFFLSKPLPSTEFYELVRTNALRLWPLALSRQASG